MPQWRCPYCATPQPEASRCWVCHRVTTSCSTCRNYRRAVAPGLGLCGLDPQRLALRATEVRPCWSAPEPPAEDGGRHVGEAPAVVATGALPRPDGRSPRTFVLVDEPALVAAGAPPSPAGPASPAPGRWSLWGDTEA